MDGNTTIRPSACCAAALLAWLLLVGVARAQQPRTISADASAARTAPRAAPGADRQDVLLMLEGGPVHVRLHLALSGVSLAEARRQFVSELIRTLDKDQDGKLSRDEANASPVLRQKSRPGANQFLEKIGASTHMLPRDLERRVSAEGGAVIGYREDLNSSKNDTAVFELLDTDKSGALDSAELAAARELIVGKDTDDDDCVSFEEFFPPPPAPTDPVAIAAMQTNPPLPLLATATRKIVKEMIDPLLPRRLRIKYDRNRDLQLDAEELGWNADRLQGLDSDANGKLDEKELRELSTATPDLDLSVDLKIKDGTGGILVVEQAVGKRLDDASRPDYAKVACGGAVVTFSLRNSDPIASAVDDAMLQFNALDADANGYLTKDETAARLRFQQSLFELLDADGDEKIFADEMKAYAKARAEPAATTCRMNLYDTGYGFFMALDANADGRVSVRERNQAAASLAELERDGQNGISQTEPVRHFHVEFVRGTKHLFSASEELLAQTPAFQQRLPTGPIWFQRMDKNNDGDLVWNEFLGHVETFHELDKDQDDLLDPQEAAAFQVPETTNTSASR
jgi:Ca2+-binding EF-hand superfamily protein